MKSHGAFTIILTTFCLLFALKAEEQRQFNPFFKAQRTYKLARFEEAKAELSPRDKDLLELWESMLTGRSAPVSKWIKAEYKSLGLNHLFTPSGFHLSAVILPFMKLIKKSSWQFTFLLILTLGIFSLSGQGALKRMILIKLNQKFLGQKMGFLIALILDVLFGSFFDSPLSFCYSFLFLGLIYSGSSWLFLWFFFAQSLIAYFSGELISPLIIILSPLLNLAFAFAMPFLVLLAYPLWGWQLTLGLKLLGMLQLLVNISARLSASFPSWEINLGVLLCFVLIYLGQRRFLALTLLVLSFQLNQEQGKSPGFGRYDFVPQGHLLKMISTEESDKFFWSDGKCERKLVRGIWWEKCSPRRKSTRKNNLKKLSSASRERRRSSLHGSRT